MLQMSTLLLQGPWIVCQKLEFCIKITLDGRENLSIWMGNMQILG